MYSTFLSCVVPILYYVFCILYGFRQIYDRGGCYTSVPNFMGDKLFALKKKFKKAFDSIVKSPVNNDRQNYSEILTDFIHRLRWEKKLT